MDHKMAHVNGHVPQRARCGTRRWEAASSSGESSLGRSHDQYGAKTVENSGRRRNPSPVWAATFDGVRAAGVFRSFTDTKGVAGTAPLDQIPNLFHFTARLLQVAPPLFYL